MQPRATLVQGAVAQVVVQFWLQELRQLVMVPSMQPWQNGVGRVVGAGGGGGGGGALHMLLHAVVQ
jgi:hypothetical protein